MYVCVHECMYVCRMHVEALRGQKKPLEPLKLELKMVVSRHVCRWN